MSNHIGLKVNRIIGKLGAISVLLFMLYECVYYNLYLYGNMDAALLKIDMNYSFDTSLFVGQGGFLKYLMMGVYICLLLAIFLYISNYSIPKNICVLWLCMLFLCFFTLARSADPFIYVTGITAFSGVLAPGTVILISSAFIFLNEDVWIEFVYGMKWVVIITLALALYGFLRFPYSYVGNPYVTRLYAFKWLKGPIGSLTIIMPFSFTFWNNRKCFWQKIVFIVVLIGSVMMQSRMAIISLFLSFLVMDYMCNKSSNINQSVKKCIHTIYIIMFAVAILLMLIVLIDGIISVFNINNRYINLFLNRMTDDTRSSQYIEHISIVMDAQPLGIGYPSTEVLSNYASYGIDNGLLMVMYYCGIPMLIVFILFFFPSILSCLKLTNLDTCDIAIISIGCNRLMWLFSSFSPSLSIGLIVLVFAVGRCYALKNRMVEVN